MKMRTAHGRRRGVIFVTALILLAGMSVIIIALANEVALDLRSTTSLVEADQALEVAKIGIDNIVYLTNNDEDWRTTYVSGEWITGKAVGSATFTASGIDEEDGLLSDCPLDLVTARSTATYNGTTRTVSARLTPPGHESMMHLAYAGDGGREIKIETACYIYGDLRAKKVQLSSGSPDHRGNIYAEKQDAVSEALKDGDTTVLVYESEPKFPTIDFDWFVARGSRISPPVNAADYVIADKVISPTNNPYGFSNANGIYYINGDREVKFIRCHITATIVVLGGKKVYFEKACVHTPAFPYYPALLMTDELYYSFDQNLSESESGVDFNTDGDTTDTFTPSIGGVVYAKKRITGLQYTGGTNIVRFKGALLSEQIYLIGTGSIFEQDASLSTTLVNQFQGAGLRLVPGSTKIE